MSDALCQILLTLAYTDQFDYSLTEKEVWQRLIGTSRSVNQVKNGLKSLCQLGLVDQVEKHYFLRDRKTIVAKRKKKHQASVQKQSEVEKAIKIIAWVPWTQAIYITGSQAVHNSTPSQDIDLMIVTQPHRLWLSRPIIILLSFLAGRKRPRHQELPNTWCLNLWLTSQSLGLPPKHRNLFTAYEVCQTQPVFDRNNIHHRFLLQNSWVSQFLPNYYLHAWQKETNRTPLPHSQKPNQQITWVSTVFAKLADNLNWLLFKIQHLYMLPHQTRELVTPELAFFHPRDTKKIIYQSWKKSVQKLNR